MTSAIRADLAEAHRQSLQHVASPGARLDAERRLQIAAAATQGYLAAEPPPPWVRPFADPALDVAFRLARYAGTITQEWYEQVITEGMHPLEWVEIVGIVVATVPPLAFARSGPRLARVPAVGRRATTWPRGRRAGTGDAELGAGGGARRHDRFGGAGAEALPGEWDNMWRLAEAQYMSDAQMVDPLWNRGTLSRPQMELAAGRISRVRECFF